MKSKLYSKTEEYIIESFSRSTDPGDIKHLQRTAYWISKLKPNADEALLIAALGHHIDRAFSLKDTLSKLKNSEMGARDKEYLKNHQIKCANIMGTFLRSHGADENLIQKVQMLINKHETGGNEDQNLLKDADSISFFENNAERFIERYASELGTRKVREKIDWMFERISSVEAKKIALPIYKNALKLIDNYQKA